MVIARDLSAGALEQVAPAASIIDLVRSGGPTTRRELVQRSGLSRTVVAQRIAQLGELGLVEESRFAPSTGGRAPREIRFRAEAGSILVIDMGATSVGVGISDLQGRLMTTDEEPCNVSDGPDTVLSRVEEMLGQMILSMGSDLPPIWGLGIGIPGPVEFMTGRPISPPIMPGWDNYPVRERLTKHFGVPSWVDNDANLMALGELKVGAGKGANELLFVKVGSGVGAGLVAGGRLYRGAQGVAGDVGHIAVSNDPAVVCRCGNIGCLEALAGGAALGRDATRAAQEGRSAFLADLLRERKALDARDLADAAAHGDTYAIEAFTRAGRLVGQMLAMCVNFYNPSRIIIGGGVARVGDLFLAAVRQAVYSRSLPLATRDLRIALSDLGHKAGLHGAAFLVADQLFSPPLLARWMLRGSPRGEESLVAMSR